MQIVALKPLRFWKQVGVALVLWILPVLGFYFCTSDFIFWQNLSLFFTKAALVTFGGAYAVLPYVAQVSVEKFNWLSSMEMMDGLALGENYSWSTHNGIGFCWFYGRIQSF